MEKYEISVLLVDDDSVLLELYHHQIRDLAQQVFLAENGVEGLKMYKEHQPDLVVTDIKMPLMNGLDMVSRIKKEDPKARAIVLSAYSESNFLIRAIDMGVKLFLVKPIDWDKLIQSIKDQAYEILLEKKIAEEEMLRHLAEKNLLHNEQTLQAVSESAEVLLHSGYNPDSVQFMLSRLGLVTQISRISIYENSQDKKKPLQCVKKFDWVSDQLPQHIRLQFDKIDNLEPFPCTRWTELLSKGEVIRGQIQDFPKPEKQRFEAQYIDSVLAAPFFVRGKWVGFMRFDSCQGQYNWNMAATNTMIMAANILGGAMQRTFIESELISLNNELEQRVVHRTKNLEREIAERKNIETMLRESEEKYRLIFENANDGIFITRENTILFINPRFLKLTGYNASQLIGHSFLEIVHKDSKPLIHDNYQNYKPGEHLIPLDIQIINSSGLEVWVEIKLSVVSWEGRTALLGFITDIDERKHFEKALQFLNTTLEERVKEELQHRQKQQQFMLQKSRLESLGEMAAGLAHEINQPLGGLSMSIENVLDELQANKLTDEYLQSKIELMFKDIERMHEIITQVRMFAREQESNEKTVFNVAEAINNSLLLVNRLFDNHQISLSLQLPDTELLAVGNATQFEQVLLNILNNARHAVSCMAKEDTSFQKSIELNCTNTNNKILITITDNGCGIPESDIDKVLDPFFTTKSAEEGTGLGLSISYGILTEMGGTIEIQSIQDQFTEVKIKIPRFQYHID